MFKFMIWRMEDAGLLINCLNCQCTWGIPEYNSTLLSEMSDTATFPCPVCNTKVTMSELKASMSGDREYSVDNSLEDWLSETEEKENKKVDNS